MHGLKFCNRLISRMWFTLRCLRSTPHQESNSGTSADTSVSTNISFLDNKFESMEFANQRDKSSENAFVSTLTSVSAHVARELKTMIKSYPTIF